MTVSLCMIVKDEELVLGRCLSGILSEVDEMIIVDTGSKDGTKKIAEKFTDKIYDFAWTDDFSAARNYAFSLSSGDYILWLDADDIILPNEKAKLSLLKKRMEKERPNAVFCPYLCPVNAYTPPLSYYRERFLKRDSSPVWQGAVHECISVSPPILHSDFSVLHGGSDKIRGSRNLDIYRRLVSRATPLSTRDEFYYARELYFNNFFVEAIARFNLFLARKDGWFVNKIEACKIKAYCYIKLGDEQNALQSLFSSFSYGEPRAGVLCEIAHIFTRQHEWQSAKLWYLFALQTGSHAKDGDFENPVDYTLTPLLGLTNACYRLGEKDLSKEYHKKARELSPTHPSVVYNEKFFQENP